VALILTLGFDAHSFARLEPLRQRYFPAGRNFIPVHVSLFQQLPAQAMDRILAGLRQVAETTAPLPFRASGIMDFSGGAAIDIACKEALDLHGQLRRAWSDILTESDDRKRKLHATVQNKVDRDSALATQARLRAEFTSWDGVFDRLLLWHYRGGPWERAGTFPLTGDTK